MNHRRRRPGTPSSTCNRCAAGCAGLYGPDYL